MSKNSNLKWLTTFLATAATVAALPVEEKQKRQACEEISATIDGVLVSWVNNYMCTPSSAAPAPAAPTTTPASTPAPAPTPAPTSAPAPASTAAAGGCAWVTATIDGAVVSWQNTYECTPAPAPAPPATTPAPSPASTYMTSPIVTMYPTSAPVIQPDESCEDVHIFIAKGNNEPYPGRQGVLVDAICDGLPSCGYENIMYDNDLSDNYCTSVDQGNVNGKQQITQYAANCPNSKLVLSGYSQGTNIVGDILGGGGGPFGHPLYCNITYFDPISRYTSPGNQIGAILFFGNNRHVGNQVYNVLNGSAYDTDNPRYQINGDFGNSLTNLNTFSDIIRDYCDESDPVCATEGPGPFYVPNHLNYFDRYTDDAANWVKGMLGYF